jgi:hypothetical protein
MMGDKFRELGFLGDEFLRRVKEFYGNGISWENQETEGFRKTA